MAIPKPPSDSICIELSIISGNSHPNLLEEKEKHESHLML